MSDPSTNIVGPEGLAISVSAVAQQVSALEKAMNAQFAQLLGSINNEAEGIRRETSMETGRLNTRLDENAEKSDLKIDSLRREVNIQLAANLEKQQVLIAKYDNVIDAMEKSLRQEIAGVGDVAMERMARFMEVKELHWHEHRETHLQEGEAIRVANQNMDKRLDSMNHLNARIEAMSTTYPTKEQTDKQLTNLEGRLDRAEQDTRRRFEILDAKMFTLEKETGIELRKEVRPVQDMKVSQAAIWAAVIGAIAIIGVIITIANFATRGP